MQTSWDGIKFICCREALMTHAYHDGNHKDGTPKYSIGFGSQLPAPQPDDIITTDEAFLRMIDHVQLNDRTIRRRLEVEVKQREWDALASLYYQAGNDELTAVASLFNLGLKTLAVLKFAEYHAGSEGLAKRRYREMKMAIDGDYSDISTYPLYYGGSATRQAVPFPPVQPMR